MAVQVQHLRPAACTWSLLHWLQPNSGGREQMLQVADPSFIFCQKLPHKANFWLGLVPWDLCGRGNLHWNLEDKETPGGTI
jgi:hypothetical protein